MGWVCGTNRIRKKLVEDISISPNTLSLQYGQSASLSASIYPEDADNKSVIWRSSNPDRISVSTEGVVTILGAVGEADIYCFSQDGGKARSNPCKITIKKIYVTYLSVSPFNLSMKPGESRKLTTSVELSEYSDEVDEVFMVWHSSNPDIASVNEQGVVTAIKEGSAEIYVTVPDKYSEKSSKCTVKVEKESEETPTDPETPDKDQVLVEAIIIFPSNISLKTGEKRTLSKSCTPSNASRQSVSWHSTDSDIASVDNQGTITGVSEGTTEIYCLSQDGGNVESNHCTVEVTSNTDITATEIPKAMKYVPYSYRIQSTNQLSRSSSSYRITSGSLPEGMNLKSDGELYGVPEQTGTFTFTVEMDNNDNSNDSNNTLSLSEKTFTLQVIENTNANIEAMTDPGYELTQRVPNLTLDTLTDQTMVSKGDYEEFVNLFLDGVKLEREVDYTAEPGSTRITIKSQTLKRFNTPGTHTLAMEFRTKRTNTLRWAAQNYVISGNGNSNTSNNKVSLRGRGSRRASSSSQPAAVSDIIYDSKKGYVHIVTGIITREGTGYSGWIQDETGWKLNYADRTLARGSIRQLEDGTTIEQILWELINGAWYAFGADGSVKDGWVYDYQLGSWYCTSAESGMKVSWHTDSDDGHTYYLEPETGKLARGWKQINNQWYYFNTDTTGNWNYNANNKEKPFGAMYKNEQTPDGYYVNGDGIWN